MNCWQRRLGPVAVDLGGAAAALLMALVVRFALEDLGMPTHLLRQSMVLGLLIVPLQAAVFCLFGLYRQVWAYASLPELVRILAATTVESVVTGATLIALGSELPFSVLVIAWFLKVAWLGGSRLALRWRWESYRRTFLSRRATASAPGQTQRILIAGAGRAGALLAREFAEHAELHFTLVGFIDDDLSKQGLQVAGRPVLGTRDQLEAVVREHAITRLIIALPSAGRGVVRDLVEQGRRLGLKLQTVPGLYELVDGKVTVSQVRDVQIEDLLGRSEVHLDLQAIGAYLTGGVVLVTGAGGSIGSELCRQVARFAPKQLVLVGHGENSIYEIDRELRRSYPALDIRPVIADVQDARRINAVFAQLRPRVVFHAAAHKHVPLMESNPEEAVKNNVFGTLNVARAADRFGADRFVLISSDKAVNPSSVMGATKRLAEYIVQAMGQRSRTIFVAVRFGNVLGSRGSVIPLFQQQIAAGGPVTVTDERMVRYFMTIPEAAQLVIQAAAMGAGGEVFLLDMGSPVHIIDLARDLIRLSGLEPDVDIPIVATGIRPGEKLYEEMLTAGEGTRTTRHERIFVAPGEAVPQATLRQLLASLRRAVEKGEAGNLLLRHLVVELDREAAATRDGEGAVCSVPVTTATTALGH